MKPIKRPQNKPIKFQTLIFLTSILLTLASCTFLYIPPVLESQEIPEVLDFEDSEGMYQQGDRLMLAVKLNHVPESNWLNVQWYSNNNEQVASDSKWITKNEEGFSVNFVLPADVALNSGGWRAVLSYQNVFIRQFSFEVKEKEPTEAGS